MKLAVWSAVAMMATLVTPSSAEEICLAQRDTGLFSDPGLTEEIRPVFQFDGVQFVPTGKSGQAMTGTAYDVRMQPLLEEETHVRTEDWACEVFADAAAGDVPQSFDLSSEACQRELSDTRITLTAATISFYESACDIAAEQTDGAGARLVSLNCYGEGSEWPAEGKLTPLADGGLKLEMDGYAQAYVACTAAP